MTINVHFPLLLEMPERELSNVIAMQKNMFFFVFLEDQKVMFLLLCVDCFCQIQFFLRVASPIFVCFHEFHSFMGLREVRVGISIVLRSLWDMHFSLFGRCVT